MKYLKYFFIIILILGLFGIQNISHKNNYIKQSFNNQNKFNNIPIKYENNKSRTGFLNKKTRLYFDEENNNDFATLKKNSRIIIMNKVNDKYLISAINIPYDIDNFSIDKAFLKGNFVTGYVDKKDITFDKIKRVYLTFDDGPTYNTLNVLKILDKYNIKATFFFNESKSKLGDKVLKEIVKRGHLLALHTASHDYQKVYKSVDSFMKDLNKNRLNFYKITGYNAKIFRFPGGSNNTISHYYGGKNIMKKIIKKVKKEGYEYVDWNAYCMDIEGECKKPSDYLKVVDQVKYNDSESVVLIHVFDKYNSLSKGIEKIIKTLKKQGYEFDRVDKLSKPVKFKLP